MPGSAVADDLVGDAVLLQLPGSQAGALQARPGLIDQHVDVLALLVRHVDHAQGRAPIDRRQRAGVAVVHDGIAVRDQSCADLSHAQVGLDVFVGDALRLIQQPLAQLVRR